MSIDDVSTVELSGLVGHWSTPDAGATVPRLILDRIAAVPDRLAVHNGDTALRYREIGAAAELLAQRLRARGVGPGDLVPLVMNNGPELPVAILAVMILSAVFVPMDAQWPKRRIDTLIAEIGEPVVLCSAGVARPDWVAVDVFALVAESVPLGTPPRPLAGPDDVVYGFYTSGSTGLPKCALNLHRGLYNRFRYMTTHFSDSPDEVILQTSRHVFDASLWQLLWPLTNGARVVIPQRNGIFDFDAIVELIERHQVTITDFVPSVFNILVEMLIAAPANAHRLRSLRTVLIGGEEINPRAVRRFRELVPGVRIVNTYGPTEASIGSVFHEVTDADGDHIPIGHPIDNTAALILDEQARPLPHGAIGELYLGGECVGAGYLHDKERTDEVFVPNPFPQVPGDRLYRTGDLAVLRADGAIDYAGRRDHQVKIGGVRIELMEVEAALRAHPLVHEAKVVVHGDVVKRLAGFVTTLGRLSVEDLREHAQRTLSRDFLPARLLVVDQLPLTQTGKTDRGALLRLLDEHDDEPAEDELDPLAAALRKLWHQLLPGASAGLSDNFFDLGGDSLSAQRLVVAVRTQLDLSISVRDVVDWPTLGGLARRLSSVTPLPEDLRAIRSRIDADVDLPDDVGWRGLPARSGLRDVLLTGATGFVGAQLLHDLITRTDATVHCLVRARDTQAARERLDEAVHTYQLLDGVLPDRVIPIAGDLDMPGFGLSDVDYAVLAARIDTIVHSAALVNLVLSYEKHRATNVLGTVEILRLASTGLLKQLHFVSTLSSVESGDHALNLAGRLAEEPVPESTLPRNGYSQSKWVAELVLARASERGIPTAVYRLGEAMPNSATGVPNRRSLADLIVRACLRVGCTFTSSIIVDYTPVDYIGELLTAAVQRQVTGYYHVFQPDAVRFDDMLGGLGAELGLPQVSYPDFWTKVRDASAADPDDPVLAGVLALLPDAEEAHTAEARLAAMFRDPTRVFSTARTAELMLDAKVNWSELDTEILGRYSAYVTASEAART
ncbi:MAG TPA: amino acid adenylation domain-containing protein [Pseudonocardiaceae bacterium]|jgi:amino acid adenylation domain-containing protein/thioester reductase-like protein